MTLSAIFRILRYFVENGVLQIVNVSHSDQGVYTCVARTPVDGDEASATLLVLGKLTNQGAFRHLDTTSFIGGFHEIIFFSRFIFVVPKLSFSLCI